MKQKTEKELFVLNNYMHMTKREIANELNISIPTIEYYLKKMIFIDVNSNFPRKKMIL